jgi:hypothetical protein
MGASTLRSISALAPLEPPAFDALLDGHYSIRACPISPRLAPGRPRSSPRACRHFLVQGARGRHRRPDLCGLLSLRRPLSREGALRRTRERR